MSYETPSFKADILRLKGDMSLSELEMSEFDDDVPGSMLGWWSSVLEG